MSEWKQHQACNNRPFISALPAALRPLLPKHPLQACAVKGRQLDSQLLLQPAAVHADVCWAGDRPVYRRGRRPQDAGGVVAASRCHRSRHVNAAQPLRAAHVEQPAGESRQARCEWEGRQDELVGVLQWDTHSRVAE